MHKQENKRRLQEMLGKAADFSSWSDHDNIWYFYRNKSSRHFNKIAKKQGNIMTKTMKDGGGDPLCPLNRRLEGLFFSATLYHGELPTLSPFGDTRLLVPVQTLFNDSTNLYFADFYCKGTTGNHYVTLVLAKGRSTPDKFCKNHLIRLDKNDNPFLWREEIRQRNGKRSSVVKTVDKQGLWVEVFYTEDINIYGMDLEKTGILGQGHSTVGGIPKNRFCSICNV